MSRGTSTLAVVLLLGGCGPAVGPDDTGERSSCAEGYLLDGDACVPEACGRGPWGQLELTDDTIFVDAGAQAPGQGTAEESFPTILQGLDAAADHGGGLVVLAAGVYFEVPVFEAQHDGVHLAGRCRDLVVLDGSQEGPEGVGIFVYMGGAQAEISGVTSRGASDYGLFVAGGGVILRGSAIQDTGSFGLIAYRQGALPTTVRLEDSRIERATGVGAWAQDPGTSFTLLRSQVLDTQPDGDLRGGYGVDLRNGAAGVIQESELAGNRAVSLISDGAGTTVELIDSIVRDTTLPTGEPGGHGVQASEGVTLTVQGGVLQDNGAATLVMGGEGTSATLTEVLITAEPWEEGRIEILGVQLSDAATLTLVGGRIEHMSDGAVNDWGPDTRVEARGTVLANNRKHGFYSRGPRAQLRLDGVWIEGTDRDPEGEHGSAVSAWSGTDLVMRHSTVLGSARTGVLVASDGSTPEVSDDSTAEIEGCYLGDTTPVEEEDFAAGLNLQDDAEAILRDSLVVGNASLGVVATGGARLAVRNSSVLDTRPSVGGDGGFGVEIMSGAELDAEGLTVARSVGNGVQLDGAGTAVLLVDSVVRQTQEREGDDGGFGMSVLGGAEVEARGLLVEECVQSGVRVGGFGSALAMSRCEIRDTYASQLGWSGVGLVVHQQGRVSLASSSIQRSHGAALVVDGAGSFASLRGVTVSDGQLSRGIQGTASPGLNVQYGAVVTAEGLDVLGNEGPGLYLINEGSELRCLDCTIEGSHFAGAAVLEGASLELIDSSIRGTVESTDIGGGVGLYAHDDGDAAPSTRLEGTTIEDNQRQGAWLWGEGSHLLIDSTLRAGPGDPHGATARCADAVYAGGGLAAWDGSSGLGFEGGSLEDATGAGLFLDGSTALLEGTAFLNNGYDVIAQGAGCEGLDAGAFGADSADVCPTWTYPTCYEEFVFTLEVTEIDQSHGHGLDPRTVTPPALPAPVDLPLPMIDLPDAPTPPCTPPPLRLHPLQGQR